MRPEDYARARELFHELFELPRAERRAALDERGIPDDVRRALEGLFEREDARESGADDALAEVGSALFAATLGRDATAPSRIGEYRVLRVLGEGGMGIVYEARHAGASRAVALKVLRHGPRTRSEVARFLREAELLRQLRHPGIAAFFEVGSAPIEGVEGAELPYIAMELVDGAPLPAYAERERLDDDARVALFAKVCDAVEHAHRIGVVHRDLKPANVLVSDPPGGEPAPKVLDFGVARAAGLDAHTMTETGSGVLIGTLPYMSPEQVSGDAKRVDARSDVYSLGVLLHELLSGELPYAVRDRPLPDVARVICEVEPRRLGSVHGRLRGNLEHIVGKALEKDPIRRYASAGELAADLRRHLARSAIVARPPSWTDLARRFARRNRTLVAAAAGTFAALLLGLAATTWLAVRESAARREADANAAAALRNAYRGRIAAATSAIERRDVVDARRQLDEAPAEQRGWEWMHLASRLDDSLARLDVEAPSFQARLELGIGEDARRVRFVPSPDPANLWSLYTWSWRTDEFERRELGDDLRDCRLDPSGEWLVLAREDLRVERAADGWERARVTPARDAPRALVPLRGAERVSFRENRSGFVLERGADAARPLGGAFDSHEPVQMADAGGLLAFVRDGELVFAREGDPPDVHSTPSPLPHARIVLSPDGTRAAVLGEGARDVLLYDTSAGETPRAVGGYRGHEDGVACVAFSPDGRRVASAGEDRVVRVWSASDASPSRHYAGHRHVVRSVEFSADGALLVSAAQVGREAELLVWDAGERDPRELSHEGAVLAVAFAAGGERVLTGDTTGVLRMFDARSSREFARLESSARRPVILSIATDPAGRWLAYVVREDTGTRRKSVVVLDAVTGEERARWRTADTKDLPLCLSASPGGGLLATCEAEVALELRDPLDGSPVASTPTAGPSPKSGPAWSPDGERVATFTEDGGVVLLDGRTLAELATLRADAHARGDLAFSPDGRMLAACASDSGLVVWDLDAVPPRSTVLRGTAYFRCLAFAPDGRRLFAAGIDRALHVWDARAGVRLARLEGHLDALHMLAASPDGRRVVTAAGDGTARIHEVEPLAERVRAREEREAIAARVGPRVERWVDELGAREADRRARAEPGWSEREREIASQLVLARGLAD